MDSHETTPAPAPAPKRGVGKGAIFAALILGAIVGGMAVEYWLVTRGGVTPAAQAPSGKAAADLDHLIQISPTQSHTMKDVGHAWANLWFAVQKDNWPLATYFFNQARQAVRWTVLLRPVRQLPDGSTVDLQGQFNAIDPSAFAFVQLAIEDRDKEAFETAYTEALKACQTCHAVVGYPFLRPTVPTAPPPTSILSYEK